MREKKSYISVKMGERNIEKTEELSCRVNYGDLRVSHFHWYEEGRIKQGGLTCLSSSAWVRRDASHYAPARWWMRRATRRSPGQPREERGHDFWELKSKRPISHKQKNRCVDSEQIRFFIAENQIRRHQWTDESNEASFHGHGDDSGNHAKEKPCY